MHANITAFPCDGQKQRICASFHFKDGRSTFLLRVYGDVYMPPH